MIRSPWLNCLQSLATAMAATGWRTLLIDLDPQGN
ncbi:MAG: ParA family protein, partial [Okeania sp. SIO2D1]|nr:ParA family protein [Okeania sp. SIO2D1]